MLNSSVLPNANIIYYSPDKMPGLRSPDAWGGGNLQGGIWSCYTVPKTLQCKRGLQVYKKDYNHNSTMLKGLTIYRYMYIFNSRPTIVKNMLFSDMTICVIYNKLRMFISICFALGHTKCSLRPLIVVKFTNFFG